MCYNENKLWYFDYFYKNNRDTCVLRRDAALNTAKELFKKLKRDFDIDLTPQQQEIVCTTKGPLCAIAVPGSGKTLTYVVRIAYLILVKKVAPERILALTFSRAAARDMEERFLTLFGDMVEGAVHFSTIHSFALGVVRRYKEKTGLSFHILEGENAPENKFRILKDIYRHINQALPSEEKVEELANAVGFVKNMLIKPDNEAGLRKCSFDIENFVEIYKEYEKYKEENRYMDYDDMLVKALDILKNDKDLLEEYQKKYAYIQLDEGQDTSKIQHEIVKLLARPDNNLLLVGDDDQSIYRFRAAFPEEMLNFQKTYPNAKILYMEENFRSTRNIVETAGKFIETNRIRYKKKVFTRNGEGDSVKIVRLNNDKDQYSYLIRKLKHRNDLSETAILYRNNISAIGLVEQLEREGIPFRIRDYKNHFFSHWVVQDILAFLNLALDDRDIESFSRIYNKGLYVSNEMLQFVQQGNPSIPVFDRLIDFPYFQHGFQKDHMIRMKWDFYTLAKKPPLKAISFIEEDLGYKKYLQSTSKNAGVSYENAKGVLANLKLIAEGCPTIEGFKERLVYLDDLMKQSRFNEQAVVLSTIHSSKGLEWDNVYMIDLINGQFPTKSSLEKYQEGDPRELEEERRLFYVGMTRARKELKLLTVSLKHNERIEASMFVKEVDRILNPNSIGNILAALNQKKTSARSQRTPAILKEETKKVRETGEEKSMKASPSPFQVNTYINHKKYGRGKIVALNGDDASIEFENGQLRQFRLNVCVEKNIITLSS